MEIVEAVCGLSFVMAGLLSFSIESAGEASSRRGRRRRRVASSSRCPLSLMSPICSEMPLTDLDAPDAGPVWYTEAYFQRMIRNPVDLVEIPESEVTRSISVAGGMKDAPHKQAAADFLEFLRSDADFAEIRLCRAWREAIRAPPHVPIPACRAATAFSSS